MPDITLSLRDIKDVQILKLDGVGEFEVRKLSAPEQLDLQAKQRRAAFIVSELYSSNINKLKGKKDEDLTDEDYAQMEAMKVKAEKLGEEVEAINRFQMEINKRRFTDISGGDAVEKLFENLSNDGIAKIFELLFGEKQEETVEA